MKFVQHDLHMRLNFRFAYLSAFCCVLLHCRVSWGDDNVRPIEGLKLPLEYYDNGKIKTELKAEYAKVPQQGDIEASNVRVAFYDENGKVDALILADECRYSRDKAVVSSESKVSFTREGIVITGTGLEWTANEQFVRILDDVRVVVRRISKINPAGLRAAVRAPGQEGAEESEMVITSRRLTFDYKRSIAVFRENVILIDPRVKIESDRLNVLFDSADNIKSATALGNVRLRQEDKTAVCRKAVFLARTGEVILMGEPKLNRGNERLAGEMITFRLDEDRMTCERARLIIYPDG